MNPERWRRVEEIFSTALDCEPSSRLQYLEEACAGDAELRTEVDSLLAHDEQPAAAELEATVAAAAETLSIGDMGRQIGPYRLVEVIGRGGMGTVYKALRDDDNYRQAVAIKLVGRGMDSEFILARFRHERQILANLNHPNIARIFDGGSLDDGRPYFVMEYIDGDPIVAYCERNDLSIEARLELFRSVCAAVTHAHQKLVIHRDIKPGNILVTPEGVPKLLDFGIAKLMSQGVSPDNAPNTGTSVRLMTPDYASPEQVRGEPLTTATDTYSLGALLYELLTERRPYKVTSSSAAEIERVVCETDPPRPSMYRRELRGDLDNIVLLAMRKEPERRYGSVEQFSQDIGRHLDKRPVIARTDTVRYRAGKFVRRNRVAVLASIAVAASLIGGIVVSTYQARRAERRFQQVRKLAGEILFDFHDKIQALPGATEARAMVIKKAQEYLDSLAAESVGDAELRIDLAESYRKLGGVLGGVRQSNLGDTAAAMENYRKAEAILVSLAERDARNERVLRNLAQTYEQIGYSQTYTASLASALGSFRRSAETWEKLLQAIPENANDLAAAGLALVEAARIQQRMFDYAGALESTRRGAAVFERGLARDGKHSRLRSGLATAETMTGTLLSRSGRLEEAISSYRRARAIRESLVSEDPNPDFQRDLMISYANEGDVLGGSTLSLGNTQGALESFRHMLAIAERFAAADPRDKRAQSDLGISLMRVANATPADDPEGSLKLFLRALGILEGLAKSDAANARLSQSIFYINERMGRRLDGQGRREAALEHLRKAVSLGERITDADPSNLENVYILLNSYGALSNALAESKARGAAMEICRAAMKRAQAAVKAQPQSFRAVAMLPRAMTNEADTLTRLGAWDEARERYQQALEAWQGLKKSEEFGRLVTAGMEAATAGLARCENRK